MMKDFFNKLKRIAKKCNNDCELRIYEDGSGTIYADGQHVLSFKGLEELTAKLSIHFAKKPKGVQ